MGQRIGGALTGELYAGTSAGSPLLQNGEGTYTPGVSQHGSGSTATPVQFAGASGYQADAATGLMLLGHRYYDASLGRFLSSDAAQAGSNWYAYCDNNPLGWVPHGTFAGWGSIR